MISTPKTDMNRELHVGMLFKSIEEAECCYQDYGGSMGFSIKKRLTYKTLARSDVTCVAFSCVCEGIYKEKSSSIVGKQKRRTSTIKSGCNARMRIRWIKEIEMWKVSVLEDEQNLALVTPSKIILMKSQRRLPTAAKSLT
ncbi:protein FAR1-RELATED SEQUENCE 5-like [Iris pallida]|uniref:Protein FAR1-RELATED SEQUENCE 5-like n=1 Tax=Iris pallida TaxID=29817 RepID=A0AAX6FS29_IRIPA|nr:protein FAR1-RELATED SEQUENCE 5-like [Iris pallida]KAJ6850036.1 protein FAR1-RELATED SEQUENCE 5-like [Iris pallida]